MNIDTQFPMTLTSYFDDYAYATTFQKLEWNTSAFTGEFCVFNLNECPEDAIIGRDLFDANDYIQAVKFGMALAAHGYTDIAIDYKEVTRGDDEKNEDSSQIHNQNHLLI